MKTNKRCPKWLRAVVALPIFFLLLSPCQPAYSYDRDMAIRYGVFWGGMDGSVPRANTVIYWLYLVTEFEDINSTPNRYDAAHSGTDCANFTSQCLIAGGMRFRSSYNADDNTGLPALGGVLGACLGELETNACTRDIKNTDMHKYSRTITSADDLYTSLKHSRHQGLTLDPIPGEGFPASHPIWNNIKPGDTAFIWHPNENRYGHAMFVSGVNKISHEVSICGHDHQRSNTPLDATRGAGDPSWRDAGTVYHFIHVPDAPLLKGVDIRSDGLPIDWKWASYPWKNTGGAKKAGRGDLVARLRFDSDMSLGLSATVTLEPTSAGWIRQFVPLPGDGFNQFGWYIGGVNGDGRHNRIWRGKILGYDPANIAQTLPADYNGIAKLVIGAAGEDTTVNDKGNELSKYTDDWMQLLSIDLDTRSGKGKTTE